MDFQYASWLFLVALFCVSLLVVLAWLVQFSLALLRPRRGAATQSGAEAAWQLPFSLTHQTLTGGVWGSLLRLRPGRDGAASGAQAGVKGLLSSLFAFKSFREHWQRAWVRALNEQACRQGSSIQIAFDDGLQLPTSASIDHVTCTDQSAHSMVLQCSCSVDTVTFPVTVTQQSPAAVSMDTYQVTMEPVQAQLQVCLEEVEEEGLLVSWTFSQQPLLSLTITPRQRVQRAHRESSESEVDMDMVAKLVEEALYATQPAMILNLRACVSSPAFPREKPELRQNYPQQGGAVRRLLVRQLKASSVRKACQGHAGELCCVLSLDSPTLEKRTQFQTPSSSSIAVLEWPEDLALDLQPETKELKIRLVERNSKREQFLPGHACLSLDLCGRSPSGHHTLSITPGHGLPPIATINFELQCVELNDTSPGVLLHPVLTPSKKVDVDRTVMPDGTIVTTVTTIQSRPKLDRKPGDSPSRSPSKVEVTEKRPTLLAERFPSRSSISPTPSPSTESPVSNGLDPVAETAIRQLTESSSKSVKKTPTKRSTLIISGVSKVPITEDDSPVSVGYAAAMDAALQGECCGTTALNHHAAAPHQDADETTPSDASERPSVDDAESETGSTGALETRSLKDHKVGFLRSGTKLLFRRRHKQKDPSFSQSHEDMCNLGNDSSAASCSPSSRKKGGSFSRRLIKRFSFRSSRSKGKGGTANGGTAADD